MAVTLGRLLLLLSRRLTEPVMDPIRATRDKLAMSDEDVDQ
jgi:hypothetical protein